MKIKKIPALAIAATMLFSLAACGSDNSVDSIIGTPSDTGKLNVGLFYCTYSDAYTSSVRTALDQILSDEGITYQDYDANSNQVTQNEQIDTAILQNTNLLIVDIVAAGSAEASKEIIDKAKAADIPVIFFNRTLAGYGDDEEILKSYDNCVFVGTDAAEAGHMQGQMIGEYLLENWDAVDLNNDGQITYAMFKGQEGSADADYLTKYAVEDANEVLTKAGKPGLVYFDTTSGYCYQADLDGKWSTSAAYNYMASDIDGFNEAQNNMIELVICNNDSMAEGVILALNEKGYNLGDDISTTIPVFGVGATENARQLMAEGKMTGTIKQDAEGMASCIALIAENVGDGKGIMDGTEGYRVDSEITNKIYIPYTEYAEEQ